MSGCQFSLTSYHCNRREYKPEYEKKKKEKEIRDRQSQEAQLDRLRNDMGPGSSQTNGEAPFIYTSDF